MTKRTSVGVIGCASFLLVASTGGSCEPAPHGTLLGDRPRVYVVASGLLQSGTADHLVVSMEPCRNWSVSGTIGGVALSAAEPGQIGCTTLYADRISHPALFELAGELLTLELTDESGSASMDFDNLFRPPSITWKSPGDGVVIANQRVTVSMFPGPHILAPTAEMHWYSGASDVSVGFVYDLVRTPTTPDLTFDVPANVLPGSYDISITPQLPDGGSTDRGVSFPYAAHSCVGLSACVVARKVGPGPVNGALDVPIHLAVTVGL